MPMMGAGNKLTVAVGLSVISLLDHRRAMIEKSCIVPYRLNSE
jgi:hypothetical protein